ncbi:MAG: phenylalanine--tRNA ligase subunit beta [Myxococcota bacterium]
MKASHQWLRSLLKKLVQTPAEVAAQLTAAGVEVEGLHDEAAPFANMYAVEITAIEPHPNAEKLRLATVRLGEESLRIVCGAPNIEVGMRVPLARIGAVLPSGMRLESKAIRGIESQGMLCSASELGLSAESSGVLVLPPDARVGAPLAEALGRTDVVYEIAPPANRPDLLSHLGIAREVGALLELALVEPELKLKESKEKAKSKASVRIEASDRAPRYLGRVIEGVSVGPSPAWLVRRLEGLGLRSISNLVDATNLVLFELGQPLHAFDLDKLGGQAIIVRTAKPGERLRTLDGQDRALDPDDLVIADQDRAVALAGVMGGADSEVTASTTRVLLESAAFDPRSVRRTSKRHALHTEASHRFERGIDPAEVERALDRCAQLIVELAGGAVLKGRLEAGKKAKEKKAISLRAERATALLGRVVTQKEIRGTLGRLGLSEVKTKKKRGAFSFVPPSYRLDLALEVDLIDELARVGGYALIPTVMPGMGGAVRTEGVAFDPIATAARALVAEGYLEAISLAFSSRAQCAALGLDVSRAVEVQNPLGEESALMRTSMLPALLKAAVHNQSVMRTDLRLFEIGKTFIWGQPAGELPVEESSLGVLLRGRRGARGWWEKATPADVLDLKGTLEALLEAFGVRGFKVRPAERPFLHPGATGEIFLGEERLGVFGELHPEAMKKVGLEGAKVFVAELSLDVLNRHRGGPAQMRSLPRFPGVGRDLSFFLDRKIAAEDVLGLVARVGGPDLEDVEVFDVYEGKGVPEGKRSMAVSLAFRRADRTLTDGEVDASEAAVIQALRTELGADVRVG